MHPLVALGGRVEVTKTEEQIRDEAAKYAAADLQALLAAGNIAPNEEVKLQVMTGLFLRARDEIRSEATTVHVGHGPDEPCPAGLPDNGKPDDSKLH